MIRAKMTLAAVSQNHYNPQDKTYTFNAVCDDGTEENAKFAKYTPSGTFTMACNNPAVQEQMVLGKTYYFDITLAD